jgi:hypothetical protein
MYQTQPFTDSEFNELKTFMKGLGSYLPQDKASWIWSSYNTIKGTSEREPCMCPSSSKLWANAVREIEAFIKSQPRDTDEQKGTE